MFCNICQNFMDITNNVANTDKQTGGADDSSGYDITNTSSLIADLDIMNILSGNEISINIKDFNITDLNKNQEFNKLDNNQKTLVINRILERLPKNNKTTQDNNTLKEFYLYCKNCGYNEKIPPRTFIFKRGNEKGEINFDNRYKQYKYNNTYPNTKNYTCINDNCPTHNDPKMKKAVFYRHNNSYAVRYICTVCDSFWNASNT